MSVDDVDEIAVERACLGDRTVTLNRAEATEAINACNRRGLSLRATAELLGITDRTVYRVLSGETALAYPRQGATVDSTKEKIATALKHDDIGIRRAAERANSALANLDRVLADWDAKALARERVAELEQQLAEAKAILRPPSRNPVKTAKNVHKLARAWARENGIQVPDIGRVPNDVLDQWRQATGAAA